MKTLYKATLVTLILAGWAATGTGANAQTVPSTGENNCEPYLASVQYAKTRIGNLCLFRGSWICQADYLPQQNCEKTQPDTNLGEG